MVAIAILSFSNCNNNDDDAVDICGANFNYAAELVDEAEAFSNAAAAFSNDPSTENCQAYKAALTDYLDAAADLDYCVQGADRDAYLMAIANAQASADALQC